MISRSELIFLLLSHSPDFDADEIPENSKEESSLQQKTQSNTWDLEFKQNRFLLKLQKVVMFSL